MKREMSSGREKRYDEEFRRRAIEMLIHSGKTQAQIARELGVSGFTLNRWKKLAVAEMKSEVIDGKEMTPEEAFKEIRRLQRENEYLKRQREILKKAMSILGEESAPGMR
jgi:transposase